MTATTNRSTPGADSPARITVLISGSGSNLQALIDARHASALPEAEITHVISDRKDAYGLRRAEAVGIKTSYHGIVPFKKQYPDSSEKPQYQEARRAYDADLARLVISGTPDIVVCAGFMRILTTAFLDPVKAENIPIINLHPSKPGDLIGAGCIERAWDEFEAEKRTETGIMIHYVIEEVDMGEPIVRDRTKTTRAWISPQLTHYNFISQTRFIRNLGNIFTTLIMTVAEHKRVDSLTEPVDERTEYATAIARSQPDWERMAAHANTGTPYIVPEDELRILQDPKFGPDDSEWRDLPVRVTLTQAHLLLKHAAGQRLTWAQMAARQRLLEAHRSPHGTRSPGLLIKMVNDLDTILFGGALRNRILVHWINMSTYTRRLDTLRSAHEKPLATVLATTVVPPKRLSQSVRPAIYLSAEIMCYASESKVQPLALLIHEMLHAYLGILVRPDLESATKEDEKKENEVDDFGKALTDHDAEFEASCEVLAAKLGSPFLKLTGRNILRYYDGPSTLIQLRDVEKREHVRMADGLLHHILPRHLMPRGPTSYAPKLP
ncbi:Bifunctional purine biosynthetic protein ADE5,7 [Recurvomyces mirabilis]|uniref:phosphoribosylglycinamide formyltransferase 1 n=1 Tax=Recurvomyces mirabilis TaxID=574656 RepID=A0AAE0WT70_9PEZI|nr:Bifunctional purine biosynthetic protein ADE5,7 [Recurvomyces mirabilis]KAK5157441.1 Bifunctional purine biosynthetic protein ADE5,7 [Recurvomyces mirabilis]